MLVLFAGDVVVLVLSLRWWCCCAGDFVVLVISMYLWLRCAGDFVALVMFAGAFVVLVISLRWWCGCAGDFVALVISLRWWFRCDFIALAMFLSWWWFRCAGGDVVVLVSCLFVNCCSGAFAETIWAHDAWKKRFVFLLQRFALVVQESEYIWVRGFHLVFKHRQPVPANGTGNR